jgi:hypothetical protein
METAQLEIPVTVNADTLRQQIQAITSAIELVRPGESVAMSRKGGNAVTVSVGGKAVGKVRVHTLPDASEGDGLTLDVYLAPDEELRSLLNKARVLRQEQEQAAHPTRLIAGTARGMRVKLVTLDGKDVTRFAQWADPVRGEVGLFPSDGEKIVIDDSGRCEPVIHRGVVEVTFEEGK